MDCSARVLAGRRLLASILLTTALALPATAAAQDYPEGPVSLIVAYNAGGGVDANARLVAAKLTEIWDEQVLVVNQPGAEGLVAGNTVATAEPDGHTLGFFVNHHTNPPVNQETPYDTIESFTPILQLWLNPNVAIVNPDNIEAKTLQEFIDLAKSRPGELNYGSLGFGSSNSVATRDLFEAAGIELTEVVYTGAAQAVPALHGGEIDFFISAVATVLGDIKAGTLTALAVTSPTPATNLPGVPPASDTLPGYSAGTWYGIVGPAGLSEELVQEIRDGFVEAVNSPDIKDHLENEVGSVLILGTPEEFGEFIRTELDAWRAANE